MEHMELTTDTPLETVKQYIHAFNKGDVDGMAAAFASTATILDGMAPHFWNGSNTTRDWYQDVLTEGKHLSASNYFVTIGEPLHNNVTKDAAYIVVPTTMSFNLNGKSVTQTGASFTVALVRNVNGWRISAWAWTKGTAKAN